MPRSICDSAVAAGLKSSHGNDAVLDAAKMLREKESRRMSHVDLRIRHRFVRLLIFHVVDWQLLQVLS